MDIIVKYNGVALNPTPLVQQSYQFIDYGSRWGNVLQIQIDGLLTGLTSTGNISNLLNVFTGQFGNMTVTEGNGSGIYNWDNLYVEEISLPENVYFNGAFVPYSVKLHRAQVPSGVLEPVNEYSFTQGEDGTVIVNHKISAKGIKNVTGAFSNAINFVRSFTGINPFAPAFIPSGQSVMMSLAENINRMEGIYGITEIFKYNTGSNSNYLEWFNATVTDDINSEYLTIDTSLKIQGSPINNSLNNLETGIVGIENFQSRLSNLGFDTGKLMTNTFSVSRDSGSAVVDIRRSFISGYSVQDLTGFFDYQVYLEKDLLTPKESWRLEGDFVCKGPLDYRRQRLLSFKTINGADWRSYFSGLIVGSPVWTTFHSGLIPSNSTVGLQENTGMATFHGSFTFTDGTNDASINSPKYTVEVYPSRWAFDLLPSANIEGHYVVQDLQMMTKGRVNISVNAEALNPIPTLSLVSGYVTALENIYIYSGVVTNENVTTGMFDISYSREWLGYDNMSSGLLNTKTVGSTVANYLRQPGFKFGY